MTRKILAGTMAIAGVLFAGTALAQTVSSMPTNKTPVWHYNRAAEMHAKSIGNTYTAALNELYSHGFYDVHHMSMMNGKVEAAAVSPAGGQQTVVVNPWSGQIASG